MCRKARGRKQKPAAAVQSQKQDPDKSQACGAVALVSKCLRCCGTSSAVLDERDSERVDLMENSHPEEGPQPSALPLQGGVEAGEGSTAAVSMGTQAQMAASLPGAEGEVMVHKQALPLVVSEGKNAAEVLQNDSQAEYLAGNTAEIQAFEDTPVWSQVVEAAPSLQAQGLDGGLFNKMGGTDTAMPLVADDPPVMASSLHTWASASSEQASAPSDIASLKESLTALSSVSGHTGLQHSESGSYTASYGSLAVEQQLSEWSQRPLSTAHRPSPQPLSKLGSRTISGNPFAEPGEYIAKQSQSSAAGQSTIAKHLSSAVTGTEQMGYFAAMPDRARSKLFPAISGNPFAEPSSLAVNQQVQAGNASQHCVQPDASSASTTAATAASQMVPAAAMPAVTANASLLLAPSSLAATSKMLSGHVDLQVQAEPPQTTPRQVAAAAEPHGYIAAVYHTATSAHSGVPAGRSLSPSADWQQPKTAVLQQADPETHAVPIGSVTKWSSMPEQSLFSTSVEAQMQEMNLTSLLYSRQAALTGSHAARKRYLRKPFSSMPSLRTSKPRDLHGSFHKLLEDEDEEGQVEVTQLSTVTEDMPTAALAMHTPAVADKGLKVQSSESSCAMSSALSVTMPQSSRASEASCVSGREDLCLLRGQTGFTDKDASAVKGTPTRKLKKLLKIGSLGRGDDDKGYGRLQETSVGASGITQQGMAEGKVKRRFSRRVSDLVAAKFGRSTSQGSGAADLGIMVGNVSTEVGAAVDSAAEAGLQSTQASAGISAPRKTVRRLSSLFSRADRYRSADL